MKSAVVDVGSPGFGAEILTSSVGNKNQACFNAYSHFWWLYEIEKSNRCYIQNSGNKKVSTCCAEDEDFFDVKTKILVNLCLFWKLFEIVNKNQAQQSSWLTHLQRFSTAETFVWSAQLRLFVLTGKKLELKLAVSSDVSRHYFDNEQRPKIVCWNHLWRFLNLRPILVELFKDFCQSKPVFLLCCCGRRRLLLLLKCIAFCVRFFK